ncbi:MAG: hypothetical protein U9N02_04255 [Campylobacterota bacterium]|nr:hypothetical protein [Campylobacterota bacterium]
MLDNIIEDESFADLMQSNIQNLIIYMFEKEQNFGLLCKIEDASFEPALPTEIYSGFRPMTLFFLAGYTFETARIVDDSIVFEAGFGADNIGSLVTVPLLSIMQIIIDETPVLINLASYTKQNKVNKEIERIDDNGVENSMASFLSNPENAKFLKK